MSQVLRLAPGCIPRGLMVSGCRYNLLQFWRLTACPLCTLSRRSVIDTNSTISQRFGRQMSTGATRAQIEANLRKWKKRKKHLVDQTRQEPTLELIQVLDSRLQQLTRFNREISIRNHDNLAVNTRTSKNTENTQASEANSKSNDSRLQTRQKSFADSPNNQSSHKMQSPDSPVKAKNIEKVKSAREKQSYSQGKVKKKNSQKSEMQSSTPAKKKSSKGKSSKKHKSGKQKLLTDVKQESMVENSVMLEDATVLLDPEPMDLHENLIVETLPDESVADEMQHLLSDPMLGHSLSQDMKQYLKRTRRKIVRDNQSPPAPFWDPSKLSSMEIVAQALEDLKKANLHTLRNVLHKIALHNDAKMSEKAYVAEVKAYIHACIDSNRLQKAHLFLMGSNVNRKFEKRKKKKVPTATLR